MKTIKNGIIGLLILMPLLLPVTTKAGGLDDWFRDFFHPNTNRPVFRPDDQRMRPGDNFYRPYDPYNNPNVRGRQNPYGQGNQDGNAVPIDGGLLFLLAAGLIFGAKKMYDLKKDQAVADLS